MSPSVQDEPQPGASTRKEQKRGLLPPEVIDLLGPPATVGFWSGVFGALTGVGVAIAKDSNPIGGGILTGVQWFGLGSSYWFTRTVAFRSYGGEEQMRPADKTLATGVAGSVAGAVSGLMRSPSSILPSIAFWGTVAAGFQMLDNNRAERVPIAKNKDRGILARWSPLTKLTNQEYKDLMNEKILRVEADIAVLDDNIAELRAAEQEAKKRQQVSDAKPSAAK